MIQGSITRCVGDAAAAAAAACVLFFILCVQLWPSICRKIWSLTAGVKVLYVAPAFVTISM